MMSLALEDARWSAAAADESTAPADPPFRRPAGPGERESIVLLIASDVRLGSFEAAFERHVEAALCGPLGPDGLRELLRHLTLYVGFNASCTAFERLAEIEAAAPFPLESARQAGDHDDFEGYSAWALEGVESLDPVLARQLRQGAREPWARPGLSALERALAALAVDVAGGTLGCSFALHVALARKHGSSFEEISAMIRLMGREVPRQSKEALEALDMLGS